MDDRIARMMVKIHRNKFGGFRLLASIFKMNRSEVEWPSIFFVGAYDSFIRYLSPACADAP